MSIKLGNALLAGIATETKTNAHSLLDWKWSDHILNEMSWLRGDTFSWQSGDVYVAAYNHLQADYAGATQKTETVGSYTITYYEATDGHKVVLADQESTVSDIYAESGVAWYYILDTVNTRFKLPRVNPTREELIQIVRAKGNGICLGVTDGTSNAGIRLRNMANASGTATLMARKDFYGSAVGTSSGDDTSWGNAGKGVGIATDSTKSGIISSMTDSTSVYKGKKYLYFYVGEFSQSATEQTAGLNAGLFNGKVDLNGSNATFSHVVETYQNGTDWYRLYSDGWVEQGGTLSITSSGEKTINLLKAMNNTDYFVSLQQVYNRNSAWNSNFTVNTKYTGTFTMFAESSSGYNVEAIWQVKGMSSQS